MKYFSCFSGIGGFEYGIQRAFDKQFAAIEQDRQGRNGDSDEMESDVLSASRATPLCVGYSEIDKYATKVYEKNFKGVKNYGDITKIKAEELPDFDCLVGGFPCQAFSIAGKRKGFDDTRGTLFFDLARILRAKQPRLFVFENVKGLLSHDNGNTFRTIIATIDELGYDCQWQVLNSKNHGVPQNRERVIIVGHLRGTPRPEVFPITGTNTEDIGEFVDLTIGNKSKITKVCRALQARYYKGYSKRQAETSGVMPVLTPDRLKKRQNGRRFKENGEPSFTLNTQDRHGIYDGCNIRRLTPIECERLQGFPDNWTALGVDDKPISDTQRYKMCGNAVTTNVIQAVFERIFRK